MEEVSKNIKEESKANQLLTSTENIYMMATALKERTETFAKQCTLKLNDEELQKLYNNYKEDAELLIKKLVI